MEKKLYLKIKRNEIWTIFLLSKNLYNKCQLYQHEADSTLKDKFRATCGAQETKIRRFPRASREETRNVRTGSAIEIIGIKEVIFGELILTSK